MVLIYFNGCVKMVVLVLCIMMLSGAKAQTYEEVLDETGAFVRFGANFSFYVISESGDQSPFLYHFDNGYSGDPVHTDTEITMGMYQNDSRHMACEDGIVVLVDTTDITPQNALIKVRRNSTSDDDVFYRLDITETPDIGVQFGERFIRCDPGLGTPFQLLNDLSSTNILHLPS